MGTDVLCDRKWARRSRTNCGQGMTTAASLPSKREILRHVLARPFVRAKLLFLAASFVSLILSVSLWFSGHEMQGVFVGIWVPSILSAGSLILSGEGRT
jgi:hypothetical protein